MSRSEVHIVIDDCSLLSRVAQQACDLMTDDRANGEIRPKDYDVVSLYFGICEVRAVVYRIFIEQVFRIVACVKEGQ